MVERARKEFDVPGIAVAIVKDGKVVLAKGYGVRKQGEPAPVTAHSLFRIASNTKAFTAAALAMLVDEGKIRWDDPVMQHMPGFQMYDPYVTREMTVRDLLVHRSGLGLGAGDLMFFPPSDLGRDEIIQRLRFLKPATSFRSGYAYDNLLYLVAGQLIPAVTGKSWDDFVRERIFTPLGMTQHEYRCRRIEGARMSRFRTTAVRQTGAAAAGGHGQQRAGRLHHLVRGGPGEVGEAATERRRHGEHAAVQRGAIERDVVGADDPADRRAIQGGARRLAATQPNFHAYGLGWYLRDYRGKRVVFHTGVLSGYVSRTALIPELKLGIVVLTNQEDKAAHSAIAIR